MKINNNKGFSLIEVLVTVGLIGILVGIAVPSYNKYKQNTVQMALKADLGSGAKTYNAYYAVESSFCAELEAVGLSKNRSNNPIYKKKGFFGFASADTTTGNECTGLTDDNLHYISLGKHCYLSTDTAKKDTNNLKADGTCPTGHTIATKTEMAYGTAPADCKLGSNSFRLGTSTDVASLGESFLYVNDEGKILEQDKADACDN